MTTGSVSAEGRNILGRTVADEAKLRRLVLLFPESERRAFWIGVLLRDMAVTVDQVLASLLPPEEAALMSPRARISHCVVCGVELRQKAGPGRPRIFCDRLECRRTGATPK